MKRALVILAQAIVLIVVGMLAGALTSRWTASPSSQTNLSVLPIAAGFNTPGSASAASLRKDPAAPLAPAGSGFTYQGRLSNSGAPANGQYDLVFTMYDAPTAGNQVGTPSVITYTNQTLTDGLFTVSLDFGSSAFDGSARYLELAVRRASTGGYITLSPRQPLSPAPYALFALKTQGYKGIVVVAQSGGDFTSIQSALNSITDNSTTNHYLVKVAPGTYTETVTMKPFVDIEGSGENVTKITYSGGVHTGTVVGANNAELRSLAVESTGSGFGDAIAIFNSGVSPSLLHVTASASLGNSVDAGVWNDTSNARMEDMTIVATQGWPNPSTTNVYGVYNTNSSPTMENLTITSNGNTSGAGQSIVNGVYNFNNSYLIMTGLNITAWYGDLNSGVRNSYTSPTIRNSTILAENYGIANTSADGSYNIQVDNSSIEGSTNAISSDSHYTTHVSGSRLTGNPTVSAVGTFSCVGSQDGNYTPLPGNCVNNTGNVVYVAKSGTKFTSIQSALNSITDNSITNRYLIKVGPGTFTETVTMKPFVDIEGSGEKATKITFTGSGSSSNGTVVGANNAELRSLTVENTGGTGASSFGVAIANSGASPSILHVTASASGGSNFNSGVANINSSPAMNNVTISASGSGNSDDEGVANTNSSPAMNNVTISASGSTGGNYGIYDNFSSPIMTNVTIVATTSGSGATSEALGVFNNNSSSPIMTNVTISASGGSFAHGVANSFSWVTIRDSNISASGGSTASYGVDNTASSGSFSVSIDNSTVSGSTNAIFNDSSFTTQVSSSKLVGGPVAPNGGTTACANTEDGNYTPLPGNCVNSTGNLVYVAKSGTRFTSIQTALNSITNNSATNRYLIKVAPGTYTETVTMKPFVDIEGSGEDNTKITFAGSAFLNSGTVWGANNAELRFLTVENTGGNTYAEAIFNSSASPSLLHVTAMASGSPNNYAIHNTNSTSAPTLAEVTATGVATSTNVAIGVYNTTASSTIRNSLITGSGTNGSGFYSTASSGTLTSTVDASTLVGALNTIHSDTHFVIRVGASRLSGGTVSANGGTLTCAGVYDENYNFFAGPACP